MRDGRFRQGEVDADIGDREGAIERGLDRHANLADAGHRPGVGAHEGTVFALDGGRDRRVRLRAHGLHQHPPHSSGGPGDGDRDGVRARGHVRTDHVLRPSKNSLTVSNHDVAFGSCVLRLSFIDASSSLNSSFLAPAQVHRGLHRHLADEISGPGTARRPNPLTPQPEQASGLRLGRNPQTDASVEGGHLQLTTERGHGKPDRYLAVQVCAVAREDGVLAHPNLDVEVAGGASAFPRPALAADPDPVSRCRRRAGW